MKHKYILFLGGVLYVLSIILYTLDTTLSEILMSVTIILANSMFLYAMRKEEQRNSSLSIKRWFNGLIGWLIVSSCLGALYLLVTIISCF